MAAAMCQALPSFYSDYCKKSLFISVSSDFYKKYKETHDYCVSNHKTLCSFGRCKFHLVLIGISLGQIFQRLDKYVYIYQEIDCFTIYSNIDSIQVLLRQAEKCSISLDEQFNIIYD